MIISFNRLLLLFSFFYRCDNYGMVKYGKKAENMLKKSLVCCSKRPWDWELAILESLVDKYIEMKIYPISLFLGLVWKNSLSSFFFSFGWNYYFKFKGRFCNTFCMSSPFGEWMCMWCLKCLINATRSFKIFMSRD